MGRGTAFDLLGVIEAGWRLDLDDVGWLTGIAEAARPALDGGFGVIAYTFDVRDRGGPPRVDAFGCVGVDAAQLESSRAFAQASDPRMVDLQYRCGQVCTSLSGLFGAGRPGVPPLEALPLPPGLRDAIGVVGNDGTDQGVLLTAAQGRIRPLDADFRRRWSRVAAHLAAAWRVRRTVAGRAAEAVPTVKGALPAEGALTVKGALTAPVAALPAGGEAVLAPDGQMEQAEGEARSWQSGEALRHAARALDRARGRLRHHDPDAALELWTSLVSGRWSLVDHYRDDGCRYLVAHRNDPRVPGAASLTDRERQVAALAALGHSNRLIAYEMGLGAPTVAAHLRRILGKLHLDERAELAPLLSGGRLLSPAA